MLSERASEGDNMFFSEAVQGWIIAYGYARML
jgi:hypothetical protein